MSGRPATAGRTRDLRHGSMLLGRRSHSGRHGPCGRWRPPGNRARAQSL